MATTLNPNLHDMLHRGEYVVTVPSYYGSDHMHSILQYTMWWSGCYEHGYDSGTVLRRLGPSLEDR